MTIEQPELIKEHGILHLGNFTAKDIETILAERYKKDVFIPQCKNGETWGARDLLKLDGWVLLRTYSPLTTIGLEIKISRQDFENDQKWTNYLDLCHLFYFVCPAGLIRATDLPSDVGIMWVSRSGKINIKHPAKRHEPNTEKLNRLLIYVLMARSIIVSDMTETNKEPPKSKHELYKEWIKNAEEKKQLALMVKGHIRKAYYELEKREENISQRFNLIEDFKKQLSKIGIVWDTDKQFWEMRGDFYKQLELLDKNIDDGMLNRMQSIARELTNLEQDIKYYKNKINNTSSNSQIS